MYVFAVIQKFVDYFLPSLIRISLLKYKKNLIDVCIAIDQFFKLTNKKNHNFIYFCMLLIWNVVTVVEHHFNVFKLLRVLTDLCLILLIEGTHKNWFLLLCSVCMKLCDQWNDWTGYKSIKLTFIFSVEFFSLVWQCSPIHISPIFLFCWIVVTIRIE